MNLLELWAAIYLHKVYREKCYILTSILFVIHINDLPEVVNQVGTFLKMILKFSKRLSLKLNILNRYRLISLLCARFYSNELNFDELNSFDLSAGSFSVSVPYSVSSVFVQLVSFSSTEYKGLTLSCKLLAINSHRIVQVTFLLIIIAWNFLRHFIGNSKQNCRFFHSYGDSIVDFEQVNDCWENAEKIIWDVLVYFKGHEFLLLVVDFIDSIINHRYSFHSY